MDWLLVTRPQLGTWLATQACALTENQIDSLLVCKLELNPVSHTSQGEESFATHIFLTSKLYLPHIKKYFNSAIRQTAKLKYGQKILTNTFKEDIRISIHTLFNTTSH